MAQATTATKKEYRIELPVPDDSQVTIRNRGVRWASIILYPIAMLAIPAGLLGVWGWFINSTCMVVGVFIGLGLGIWFASWIVPKRFIVDNPEWTALATQDAFSGKMIIYGPGAHPSLPQEERNEEGNISLEAVPLPFTLAISTGGSQVIVSVDYEYARRLSAIRGAIGFDAAAIESGIVPFIKTFLISECNGKDEESTSTPKKDKDAKWARTHVDDLNATLADNFMGILDSKGETPNDFENAYGIISVSIAISNIALPPAVQKSMDAVDESASQLAIIAKLYGYGDDIEALEADIRDGTKITRQQYTEMVEHAMAVSENAEMKIQVFRGDVPSAAASLAKGGK
ncbi:MAG: hypothetical protein Q7R59_00370 [bacterium]|nr:hypothetical protein [bacterium]